MSQGPGATNTQNSLRVVLVIFGISVLIAVATWGFFGVQPTIYRATAVLFAESGPMVPSGLISTLVFNLPRLDKVVFRETIKTTSIAQQTYQLAGIQANPSDIASFENLVDLWVLPGRDAYSDILYITIDQPDAQRAQKLSNGLAEALVNWNNQRVREMHTDYLASLEAQLKTATISVAQLKKADPDNTDLSNLVAVRSALLRDIQLVRGVAQTIKGNLKILEPAQLNIVGNRERSRSAIAGLASLIALTLAWMIYQTWQQALRGVRQG